MDTHAARKLVSPLRHTIFHPQWLLLRHERRLGKFFKPNMHGIVVDIGCAGKTARQSVIALGATYVGLDYPSTAIAMYDTRPDIFGDAHSLPVRSESADTVLILNVLEHLREPDKALGEITRVLKPGGKCLLEVPFLYPLHDQPFDYQRWTRHGLETSAARAGLQVTSLLPIGKAPETIGLLCNLMLSRFILRLIINRNPLVILAAPLPVIIAGINIFVRLLALVAKDDSMPIAYRVVLTKPDHAGTHGP
jgi:SAM-dependent methyltransferase